VESVWLVGGVGGGVAVWRCSRGSSTCGPGAHWRNGVSLNVAVAAGVT